MEEITFEDVLTHYHLKLKVASDEIEELKKLLKNAQVNIDNGWKGTSADACRFKLETVEAELKRVTSELSEAQVKLTMVEEIALEDTNSK